MKKSFKKVLASLLAAILVLTCAPLNGFAGLKLNSDLFDFSTKAAAMESSGQCGDNVYWTFDGLTGLLSVEGSGNMYGYGDSFGSSPFYNVASIKSVAVGEGVTNIGPAAFYRCTGLTDVTVPESVTDIGTNAFTACSKLVDVYYPGSAAGWENIQIHSGNETFEDAKIHYILPASGQCGDNVTYTFDSGTGLLTVSGTGSMYDYDWDNNKSPFNGISSIKTVVIEPGVTYIGGNTFSGCTGLTGLTLPDGVAGIGEEAFYSCTALTCATIPDSVTAIGYNAFCDVCNVSYSSAMTAGGSPWNAKCANGYVEGYLVYENSSKQTLCSCSTAAAGTVNIPGTVTGIRDEAFSGCSAVTGVSIPDSVTDIGAHAFSGCSGLTGVTIPDSVTRLGFSAFSYCTGLTQLTVGDGITEIKPYTFANCSALTGVTVPDSVTYIDYFAFRDCTGLTGLTVPDSVTYIDEDAFVNVRNVSYSSSMTAEGSPWSAKCANGYVEGYLVYEDSSKQTLCGCSTAAGGTVIIPDSVTVIYDEAFSGCSTLTGVIIGNGVTDIGEKVFNKCTALSDVTFGNNVTGLGYKAFGECWALTDVTIPDSVTSIDFDAFIYCVGLRNVTIGNGVTSIGDSAFYYCISLESVRIGSSVTSIGENVFRYCSALRFLIFDENVGTVFDRDSVLPGCGDALICCYKGSRIHAYCEKNGLKYCLVDDSGNPGIVITSGVAESYAGTADTVVIECASKIDFGAFRGNGTVKNVVISPSVTQIYNDAFRSCTALETVTIPQSVSFIGSTAFADCDSLTIRCYAGSYAHGYAVNHNIPYIIISPDGDRISGIIISSEKEVLSLGDTVTLTAAVAPDTAVNKNVLWRSSDTAVATVSAGVVTPVKPGVTVITAQTEEGGYKDFCLVRVVGLIPVVNTQTVIDNENSLIYGLSVRVENIEDYVDAVDGDMTIVCSTAVIGTGTQVNLICDGEVADTYETVIFGDVNGDGVYDGTDAAIVSCLANGMLTREQAGEAVWLAADVNHDGAIDGLDVSVLEQAGVLLASVDQTKSEAELQTDSVYQEYLSLIDQNPDAEETTAETEPAAPAEETTDAPADFFSMLIAFIRSVITMILNFAFPKV